jgi:hypothetical protein
MAGFADAHRLGHLDGEQRRESREPRRLALDLCSRPVDARQANGEPLAQSPDAMVGAPRFDGDETLARQVGHLLA